MEIERYTIALYPLDEGSGSVVHDASRHGNDGKIYGARWTGEGINGKALKFNGVEDHIKVPHSPGLNLTDTFTVEARVKGKGAKFSLEEKTSNDPPQRGPFFQVVGDKIFWTTNSDIPGPEGPISYGDRNCAPHIDWHIWTGQMNTDGTGWKEIQRTFPPVIGTEPKLQVVGEKIYYEYFGLYNLFAKSEKIYGQRYTAWSNIDGTGWRATSRIPEAKSRAIKTEQGNMQVVGNKIYYGYPQNEVDNGKWQLWTAESNLDGTGWKAVQRTKDGGWIPAFQVVGDYIYYRYCRTSERDGIYFVRSNIDGTDWKVIRFVKAKLRCPWGGFYVDKGIIYFTYSPLDKNGISQLWTGRMNTDGTDLEVIQRTSGNHETPPTRIQVVGNKVHYAYWQHDIEGSLLNWDHYKKGLIPRQLWTAQSNLDGTDWKTVKRTSGDIYHALFYKGIQVVGGKIYCGGQAQSSWTDERIMFGKSGSNIINKGDAYGIGLTEDNEARAFINAGQDYLFRAEAPEDTAGAIADHPIDNQWHYLVMTYDKVNLKLYVDGALKSSTAYTSNTGINPFNLIIGDSFQGIIDEVGIYGRVKTAEEIKGKTDILV